jgi:hypothetical protein
VRPANVHRFVAHTEKIVFVFSTLATPHTKTTEEWTSVLRLATKWNFLSLRNLAVERLFDITSPIDRVVLGHTFDVPEWLPLAYTDLCKRGEPLTIEEGKRLGELGHVGADIVTRLWRVSHGLASVKNEQRNYSEQVKKIFELDDGKPKVAAPPEVANAPPVAFNTAAPVSSAFSFNVSSPLFTTTAWDSVTAPTPAPSFARPKVKKVT